MTFILLATVLFPDPAKAFFLAFSGVMISSAAMYLAGRTGGYRLCEKLLGAKTVRVPRNCCAIKVRFISRL